MDFGRRGAGAAEDLPLELLAQASHGLRVGRVLRDRWGEILPETRRGAELVSHPAVLGVAELVRSELAQDVELRLKRDLLGLGRICRQRGPDGLDHVEVAEFAFGVEVEAFLIRHPQHVPRQLAPIGSGRHRNLHDRGFHVALAGIGEGGIVAR